MRPACDHAFPQMVGDTTRTFGTFKKVAGNDVYGPRWLLVGEELRTWVFIGCGQEKEIDGDETYVPADLSDRKDVARFGVAKRRVVQIALLTELDDFRSHVVRCPLSKCSSGIYSRVGEV